MKRVNIGGDAVLYRGDCRQVMRVLEAESVSAIVTDPPYGLGFMGKAWDRSTVELDPETWAAALRVAKPGAYLVAFGGTRTFHRIWCAIEDAGWELRDTLMWLYGSGFPKSSNQSGAWEGWGTGLKPGYEPIVLARKPLAGTVAENLQRYGVGALNIDGCRIPCGDAKGRWPANVLHDGSEEVVAMFPESDGQQRPSTDADRSRANVYGTPSDTGKVYEPRGDTGSAARFFWCPKASRSDRNEGLEGMPRRALNWSSGEQNPGSFQSEGTDRDAENFHPTVKPTELMRWLCRLVTPPGGTVLDPFMGSGSTGKAAALEGCCFVGIDKDPDYLEIARRRITHVADPFASWGAAG